MLVKNRCWEVSSNYIIKASQKMISRKDLRIWTKDSVMSAKIIYQNREELGNGELGIQKIFSFFFFLNECKVKARGTRNISKVYNSCYLILTCSYFTLNFN